MSTDGKNSFTFRQRAGRLNWKLISSLDVEDVVINVNISALQNVLDSVTFSEIVEDDIKRNTIDSVHKLIHIMQYIIEYLLNHQENQFSLVSKLNGKINHLKKSREQYYQQNLSFREDIRTYQRQLHLLRKGINHPDNSQPYARFVREVGQNPTNNNQIVKAILEHEKDARKSMMEILEDQRREFVREMTNIVEIFRKSHQATRPHCSSEDPNAATFAQSVQAQVEKALQCALENYKDGIQKLNLKSAVDKAPLPDSDKTQIILKQAALEELEKQLKGKAQDLKDRESSLKVREGELSKRELIRRAEDSTSKWHNQTVKDIGIKRQLGSRLLRAVLFGSFRRFLNFSFRKWHLYMLDERDKERHEKHGKMLLFAAEKKSEYQKHLEYQLAEEKEKQLDLHSKLISAKSEFDALEIRFQQMQFELTDKQETINTLNDILQQEKDKFTVLNAKFNTAMVNYNRDRQESLNKLTEISKFPIKDEPVISVVQNKSKKSWSNIPPEYLRLDLDEDCLLKFAETRVTNNFKHKHEAAKSLLAKQIFENLSEKIEKGES